MINEFREKETKTKWKIVATENTLADIDVKRAEYIAKGYQIQTTKVYGGAYILEVLEL